MQLTEQRKENFMDFFLSSFLVKAVIDELLIPFSLLTGSNHRRVRKRK